MNWDSYWRELEVNLPGFPGNMDNYKQQGHSLVEPETRSSGSRLARPGNRARNTDRPSDWAFYRAVQKEYRDSVVRARKKSWQDFCWSVIPLGFVDSNQRILTLN
ncbi:uncharacterized protein LOC105425071 [Pogonomyrmex barbatus]|uniref:Uncharacterized protein LOC105425071 n=1 Tax=Pogonomyrmex barbatus TaxID=144034 RepID=A0A6I9VXJ0_9HYME|nr:uncharacterized protein LOC105425071 [Pogonomyrmex barbatus]